MLTAVCLQPLNSSEKAWSGPFLCQSSPEGKAQRNQHEVAECTAKMGKLGVKPDFLKSNSSCDQVHSVGCKFSVSVPLGFKMMTYSSWSVK